MSAKREALAMLLCYSAAGNPCEAGTTLDNYWRAQRHGIQQRWRERAATFEQDLGSLGFRVVEQ